MNARSNLYIQRAENELMAAHVLFDTSANEKIQKEQFKLEKEFTFYSSVIGHAYYSIFNGAKALLAQEGIETSAPEVHKKTLEAFERHLVKTGKLDVELLKMYKSMVVKAEELLGIFALEKG